MRDVPVSPVLLCGDGLNEWCKRESGARSTDEEGRRVMTAFATHIKRLQPALKNRAKKWQKLGASDGAESDVSASGSSWQASCAWLSV